MSSDVTTAPLALFVYKRLWHTRQTVEYLQRNRLADQTDLIIFSDGPAREEDALAVAEVRDYIQSITGFKSVVVLESDENKGLSRSIIGGVEHVLASHDSVIVLEDDMVTAPGFLAYMNDALYEYQHDTDVISIHAYVLPVESALPDTFFLRGADCWGWATWRRGWSLFEADGSKLLAALEQRKLTRQFDFDNSYRYTKMLRDQIRGRNDSWAVRWYASAFLEDKLTLYPGKALVANIGLDASGTHSVATSVYDGELQMDYRGLQRIELQENPQARSLMSACFRRNRTLLDGVFDKLSAWDYSLHRFLGGKRRG